MWNSSAYAKQLFQSNEANWEGDWPTDNTIFFQVIAHKLKLPQKLKLDVQVQFDMKMVPYPCTFHLNKSVVNKFQNSV